MTCVADKYHEAGQEDEFARWCRRALLEAAGRADWQSYIRAVLEEEKDVDLNVFFSPSEETPSQT